MNPLIIDQMNSYIRVSNGHLQIRKRDSLNSNAETTHEFRPYEIPYDTIALRSQFGNVSLEAEQWCAKMGVSILHLDFEGTVVSQTLPVNWSNNGKLRLAQCRAYDNPQTRLAIAKSIIEAKTRKPVPNSCNTILKLMNFEAVESQLYWDRMMNVFRNSKFVGAKYGEIVGRRRGNDNKGAKDPVNCMLNWTFTVLAGTVRKYIMSAGLLHEIGFLHSVTGRDWKDNRDSLTWDMVEPFRDVAVQSVVSALQKIPVSGFNRSKEYRLRLNLDTCKILTKSFAEGMNQEVSYKERTWHVESVMQDYIRTLAQSLLEERVPHFEPFSSSIVLENQELR